MTARVRGIWRNHRSALVATLLFAVIFSLTMVALRGSTRSRASEGVQYRLQGYDKISHSWTPGNVAGYAEQESIPFRLIIENNNSTPSTQSLRLQFDNLRDSIPGIDYFVTSGTIMNGFVANLTSYGVTGPFFYNIPTGQVGYYDVSFTVPANGSVTLMWGAHLALGSHNFPGSSLHVFVDGIGYSIGHRDVPIPVKQILFLEISKTDNPDPIFVGQTTTYTITVTAGGGAHRVEDEDDNNNYEDENDHEDNNNHYEDDDNNHEDNNSNHEESGDNGNSDDHRSDSNGSNHSGYSVSNDTESDHDSNDNHEDNNHEENNDDDNNHDGRGAQTNVTVTDTLPSGLIYVSSSPPGTVSGNTITWNLGTLESGESVTIILVVQGITPGTWTNRATVESDQVPPVTVTEDTTVETIPFAVITGTKFNDINNNGVRDSGEPGLPEWTIYLKDAQDNTVSQQETDSSGFYSFTNVQPGTYTISEGSKTGWTQTFPTPPGTYTLTVLAEQLYHGNNFGNFSAEVGGKVAVSGHKYEDIKGDGQDLRVLGGWKIFLKDSQGNLLAETTTSSTDGSYAFTNLNPGTYTVVEEDKAGWIHVGTTSYTRTLYPGQTSSGNDFRNFEKAMISGTKFSDLDRDGQDREYDFSTGSWEPGLAGWTIFLTDMQGHLITQTTTDQNGNYIFTELGPGTYIVSEQAQSGWVLTFPASGTYTVTTSSGQHFDGNNFGNFQLPITGYGIIQGVVWNDINRNGIQDNEEPGLPGWTVTLYASDGTTILAAQSSGADGSYKFDRLPAGTYWVGETLLADWENTTPLKVKRTIVIVDGEIFVTIADFGNVLAVLPFTPTERAAPAKEGVLPITGGDPVSILLTILLAAAAAATLLVLTGIGLRIVNGRRFIS